MEAIEKGIKDADNKELEQHSKAREMNEKDLQNSINKSKETNLSRSEFSLFATYFKINL